MADTRVLVVGGRGFYGARVVEVLRRVDGLRVEAASRSTTPRIDLADPSTFEAMAGYDLVANCSDAVGAAPDAAIAWARARGLAWLEMGADPVTTERLLGLPNDGAPLVVGVGIFPGISTAMARAVGEGARRVEVGVRLSPLSGAGRANVDLMCATLVTRGTWWEGGVRQQGAPLGPAVPFEFREGSTAVAPRTPLPDAALVQRTTLARNVSAHLAVVPGFLRYPFAVSAWVLAWAGPLRAALLWLFRVWFWLLRALLLRNVHSAVEIAVVADRAEPSERRIRAVFHDGQMATAMGVAAAVLAFRRSGVRSGVLTMADLGPIDALWRDLEGLGCSFSYEPVPRSVRAVAPNP